MPRFYIGTSPKDAYMLPEGAHIMLNASQFWDSAQPGWQRLGRVSRGGLVFLDSGGFVFFSKRGAYPFTAGAYLNLVSYVRPDYFASLDLPCVPAITAGLQQSVAERIKATVQNALELIELEPMLWRGGSTPQLVPVIQGWQLEDYRHCIELYAEAGGIRPYMAVGSMFNRSSAEAAALISGIAEHAQLHGVQRLHFFGLKMSRQLEVLRHLIYSLDSAAVYFAANARIKHEWGGKRWAPTRAAKKQALRHWLAKLDERGLQWRY